jgi:hypothetical protein
MPPAAKREYFTGNVKDRDLDFWIEMGYNAMFIGRHGVGKTHKIQAAFERNGLKWRYFSAATMDPWTDFVGVPKERTEGDLTFLDFILPRDMADNSVEALFFDEFNRAPKKVRNAVMELIQFKSINGRKFPNLKLIWTAVNPDDDDDLDFDVEPLDPAQEDRFQIQVEIPYKPDLAYFQKKYGPESGKGAVDWWDGLPEEMKRLISPRRLDYAVQVHIDYGNLKHVLPAGAPTAKLSEVLQHGPPEQTIRKFMSQNDEAGARRWLAHMNNLEGVKGLIVDDEAVRSFALPLLGPELVTTLMSKNKAIKQEITNHPLKYASIIRDVASGSQVAKIKKEFQAIAKTLDALEAAADGSNDNIAAVIIDNSKKLPQHFTKTEQRHMKVNFRFRDGDYDISNKEFSGDDIEGRIREFATQTMSASNTWLKQKVYEGLTTLATEELTADQAVAVIRLCDWVAAKHQADSLSSMDEIPIIFNTATHCILRDRPDFSVEDLFNIAPYFFCRYFSNKNEKLPDNKDELLIEAKPQEEWEKIEDEELEGVSI